MTPPELHRTALTLLKQQTELEGKTRWTMQPAMTGKSNGGGGRRKGVTQVPRIHNILIVQLHQKFEKLIWGQTRHHSTLQMSCYSRRIQRKARLMLHLLKKKEENASGSRYRHDSYRSKPDKPAAIMRYSHMHGVFAHPSTGIKIKHPLSLWFLLLPLWRNYWFSGGLHKRWTPPPRWRWLKPAASGWNRPLTAGSLPHHHPHPTNSTQPGSLSHSHKRSQMQQVKQGDTLNLLNNQHIYHSQNRSVSD